MATEYDFNPGFQEKILFLYLRKPEIRSDVDASYFNSHVHMDICRLAGEASEKHPGAEITEPTLKAIVRGFLVGQKRQEIWPYYKKTIKKLYALPTSDDSIVEEQVCKFINERRFRQALVAAEKDINNGNYKAAINRLAVLNTSESSSQPTGYDWPKPLNEDAYEGLAGDIVRAVLPTTEADAAGLLVQFLVGFGNIVGRNTYLRLGSAKHFPNLYTVLVGRTALARKGTAWAEIRPLLREADTEWAKNAILPGGLASGEGLIYCVRDAVEQKVKDKIKVVDPGVSDKRKLVISTEFSSVIRVMQREGNILSGTMRQAFDDGDLNNQSKNSPARATGAHISIIGHITQGEALRLLGRQESSSGLVNRFLWVCVQRSKVLAMPTRMSKEHRESFTKRLERAVRFAKRPRRMRWSKRAIGLYKSIYDGLSVEGPGSLGETTVRASVLIVRLALVYALLESRRFIFRKHLRAALAVWKYCEASAQFIFGETHGYPDGEKVLAALRAAKQRKLSRSEVSLEVFQNHKKTEQLDAIRKHLVDRGLISYESVPTGGKPKEIWCVKDSGRLKS